MTERYLVKPDSDYQNLHRVGEDGEPPCGASGSEWVSVMPEDAQEGEFGLCQNSNCFGGDAEDPIDVDDDGLPARECVDCGAGGERVMPRDVGRRTVRLCVECAAERRRLTPPRVISGRRDHDGGETA